MKNCYLSNFIFYTTKVSSMQIRLFRGLLAVIGMLCLPMRPSAQLNGDPPNVTTAYYLQNVNLVASPGSYQENVNILIEDGLIQTIGSRTPVPSHARVIECDSMFVYAGFIEGISHTGIPKQEKKSGSGNDSKSPKQKIDRGNPPNKAAGIRPEQSVRDLYKSSDKSVATMRKLGFTASHVVPRDGMLPGKGSLVLLGEGETDEMILKEDVSLYLQLSPARRMYPGTVIGVMSKWRELYRQAEYMKKHKGAFDSDSDGIGRPQYNRATEALFPVVSGDLPVYFRAPNALDAHKAFTLEDDLGFALTLVELKEGWRVTDEILERNTPVMISMDLPEDQSEKKKSKSKEKSEDEEEPADEDVSDSKTSSEKDKPDKGEKSKDEDEEEDEDKEDDKIDENTKKLMERRQESLIEHYSQAAVLSDAGVSMSFSMLSVKSKDFHSNLLKMIENGLAPETALAALTTVPAKMLGVDKYVGTVQAGKMANLVVSTGRYFEEKSRVRYVFVEGVMFEYEIKKKKDKKKSDGEPAVITGRWTFEVETPGETQTGTFTITGSDGDFSGQLTVDDDDETTELENIEIDGNIWTFSMEMETDEGIMVLEYELTVEDDSYSGEVSAGPVGTFPITGDRLPEF